MKIRNPFLSLSKFEWLLWLCSIVIVSASFVLSGSFYWLTLLASLVGVTALIFVSKGDVAGQVLTVIFSLLYGIISYQYRYFGEMITYLGMTMPTALLSVYTWLKHPYQQSAEVEVHKLNRVQAILLVVLTAAITFVFYFILKEFHTANLIISTVSIATSFSASYLLVCRSPFYALAYAANDIVLIILWVLASLENVSYLPMVMCFVMFLLNDMYGLINWRKMSARQNLL
ncbi:MAG: nicotinamide mononucleotide transporter [Lachnospiraceae bacterium]|nr:nicotinamide mononucleotide transporter [Lachnospiraceae bacterium]